MRRSGIGLTLHMGRQPQRKYRVTVSALVPVGWLKPPKVSCWSLWRLYVRNQHGQTKRINKLNTSHEVTNYQEGLGPRTHNIEPQQKF